MRPSSGGNSRIAAGTLLLASLLASAAWADGSEIVIEVTTNRDRYLLGEWVRVVVSKCNPTPQPITLRHSCSCCHDTLTIVDATGATVSELVSGCFPTVLDITWEPGECKSAPYDWYQTTPWPNSGDPVPAGRYALHHVWEFPTFTTRTISQEITVGVDPDPPGSVVLDFETIPGDLPAGGPVGNWYLARGVKFHELGYGHRQPTFGTGSGNPTRFARSNVTTYPPGFNIVAELTAPADFVAADVMTSADRSVTMSAYGADGRLLGVAESAASPGFWKGRLSLHLPGIVRVEWFPSQPQASVGIDDLAFGTAPVLQVPAIDARGLAALALLLAAAAALALRRR